MDSPAFHERLRRLGPVALACLIWTLHAVVETITISRFHWLPMIWAAHGLILMLLMAWALHHAHGRSRVLYWSSVVALPVIFTFIQSWADLFTAHVVMAGSAQIVRIDLFSAGIFTTTGVATSVWQNFKVYIWLYGFYAATVALRHAIKASYDAQLQVKDAQLAAQEAQLDALRLQIGPHFLFNALNALSALVATGRAADAEAMIERLSHFYRSSLLLTDNDLWPLYDEIDGVADYLEIERVRFGDRLAVDLQIADGLEQVRAPRLILQPLVENAMKHGVARTSGNTEIVISARVEQGELLLGVANNLPASDADPAADGTGSGLGNVRNRLMALYGPAASLTAGPSDTRWVAVIRIPLSAAADAQGHSREPG